MLWWFENSPPLKIQTAKMNITVKCVNMQFNVGETEETWK